ncbi:Hypothetical predicted protein [Lecanosticta acicola]|uniref:Uncharacterized protein n=1 Tax=Lecanosticta acicola TaxID=111012 RepID=A0AAI9EE53_9PEZI|nr:Hypothetical predicted protein [Lecanosticta acicola]
MTYNQQRNEALQRLGIEQLPTLYAPPEHIDTCPLFEQSLPVRQMPVPGRRCPSCLAQGKTQWVIPGKRCPKCGTEVN